MSTLPSQSSQNTPSRSASDPNSVLLDRLRQGQLFALDPNYPGGLILFKSFYTDFAGPGSAIGGEFDRHCTAIYPVGPIRIQIVSTHVARQQTLHQRMTYAEKLANIASMPVSLRRSCMVVDCLCEWLSPAIAEQVSHELISKLVSISPVAVQLAWQARYNRLPRSASQPAIVCHERPLVPLSSAIPAHS
jgi:hypothetical protein